ncbi:MAG: hypothetical protein CL850_03670 [Crocinitomicaceae bacterium]|nr:hypothetical protein [Crocinitomicaceae bacterium]
MKIFLRYIKKYLLEIFEYIFIKTNRYFNIQFIPDIEKSINIETTSICNLGCKFCGYHKRDLSMHPLKTMSKENFVNLVNQSADFGYRNIGLSPTTGDVFMDKSFFEKVKYIDEHDKLEGFYFYTNFIPIKTNDIEKLFELKKLNFLGISIYGHDQKTFITFADSSNNAYEILIKNLKKLNLLISEKKFDFKILIGHRTEKNFDINLLDSKSELVTEIQKLIKNKNVNYEYTSDYNNWGGMINDKDVKNLNINFNKRPFKKNGSCSLIYSRMIIGSNGELNACACRDANYTLSIGNVFKDNLKKIISSNNKKYLELIDRQEKNDFPDVCKSCDFYSSIYSYKHKTGFTKNDKKFINLKKYKEILKARENEEKLS